MFDFLTAIVNGIVKLTIWSLIGAVILTIYLSESGAIQ